MGDAARTGYLNPDALLVWSPARPRSAARRSGRDSWLWALVALGAASAGAVGYIVAQNSRAEPAHVAVALRVVIVMTFVAAAAFARSNGRRARLATLLVAAGLYSSLWLLNGSSDPTLFTIGRLCSGGVPLVLAYLLLAYPSGRLRSGTERRLLLGAGGAGLALWGLLILTTPQPAFNTPLVHCAPHCPANVMYVGSPESTVVSVARAGVLLAWALLSLGTPALLWPRLRRRAVPLRRSFVPIVLAAFANALFWTAFLAADATGSSATTGLGAAYIETAVVVPLAIVAGLLVERLSIGHALATFVRRLAARPTTPPEELLADELGDPSVGIAYYDPATGRHVDARGRPVPVPVAGARRAVAEIERNGAPTAVISYDAQLADQAAFVEAAGAVAVMHVESVKLHDELRESNRALVASRLRLVEAADAERRRIERDFHDGVQQQILGLRLRLDTAGRTVGDDPARAEQLIGALGRQVDELLATLRSFAAGIYPPLLRQRGLKDALESVMRTTLGELHLHTFGLGRYAQDVEVAVYFCCLEAIQNFVKHAGPGATANVHIWHLSDTLAFGVRDSGAGFDAAGQPAGSGLVNMRDRIEAVGGQLRVSSVVGRGTSIQGRVPVSLIVP